MDIYARAEPPSGIRPGHTLLPRRSARAPRRADRAGHAAAPLPFYLRLAASPESLRWRKGLVLRGLERLPLAV